VNGAALQGWLLWVGWGSITLLAAGMILTLIRILTGPTPTDRIAGLELVGLNSTGILVVMTMLKGDDVWLDVAIVLAAITFIGTVAFCQYFLRR
jgi:multisubunit Na+/H+ antiporter MnhF subunit